LGGSLAGGIVGAHAIDTQGYRTAYLAFAAIAILATALTFALAPKGVERVTPPS
jgi:hypothetical protein